MVPFLLLFSLLLFSFFDFLVLQSLFSKVLSMGKAFSKHRPEKRNSNKPPDLGFSSSELLSRAVAKAVTPARACSKLLCAGAISPIQMQGVRETEADSSVEGLEMGHEACT